jgi:hypothetical protein
MSAFGQQGRQYDIESNLLDTLTFEYRAEKLNFFSTPIDRRTFFLRRAQAASKLVLQQE